MKQSIDKTLKTFFFAVNYLLIALFFAGCSFISGDKNAPPPEGVFPAQIGSLKLSGEPPTKPYSAFESGKYYSASYTSPQNMKVEYQLSVLPKPKDESIPRDWEKIVDAGAVKVYFFTSLDKIPVFVQGNDGINLRVDANSVAEANEILKNLPYAALKATPPAEPINISLTPASFQPQQKKNESEETAKSDKLFDQQVRLTTYSLIDMWFMGKKVNGVSLTPHKMDPSTLMIESKNKKEEAGLFAAKLKQEMGQSMKDAGFRQFVLDRALYKLD